MDLKELLEQKKAFCQKYIDRLEARGLDDLRASELKEICEELRFDNEETNHFLFPEMKG